MKEDKYADDLVKDYKNWSVYVAGNQGYLGRLVVWCKREDALDLAEAIKEEREELFEILSKLRNAAKSLFGADWQNYTFLGNETRHLHCHFVPRYSKPVEFMRVNFKDELWGHNYKTDHSFITPPEALKAIKVAYTKALS